MNRGLVISPPLKLINGGQGFSGGGGLNTQQLRLQVLLWDKLAYPDQTFIFMALGPDADFLEKEKILERVPIGHGSGFTGEVLIESQYKCFQKLEAEQPGIWSLSTIDGEYDPVPVTSLESGRGVLVRLMNSIPVPDRDVPLEEVLAFKSKRKSELDALRVHLEDVYQSVVSAPDQPQKLETELAKLQLAIADHVKISQEWGVKLKLADLSANLNMTAAAASIFSSFAMGLPLVQTLVAALPAFSVDAAAGLAGRNSASTPFKYLSSIDKALY